MNATSLYNIIYGMELFKPRFQSPEAYRKASLDVISRFREAHSGGGVIGPIDFNLISFDMDSGAVISFPEGPVGIENCNYDQWKFFPPEAVAGSGWTVGQDLYCLAVVLYALRYYSLPFDGQMELGLFSQDIAQRKDNYLKLRFVFSAGDNDNMLDNLIGASVISAWNDDTDQVVKDLFSLVFDKREDAGVRPDTTSWKKLFCKESPEEDRALKLTKDAAEIRLKDGLEILKKDLFPGGDESSVGRVVSSNKDKNVLALGNTSGETWIVDLPDGQKLSVAPQSAAPIVKGAVIDFGSDKWEIK